MARQRPTRLVMGPCIVEIDRIVIREVQYQFEVNRCRNEEIIVKGNFGWVWSMWAGRPRVGNGAMHKVQYQFEVNHKGNFGWVWSMWAGAPGLVMGPCIVEIDPNVIREVQYQFEVNPCRNEKIIVNGIFGGCGLCGRGAPGLGLGAMHIQYQFEVNPCRNDKIIVNGNFWWVWPMWAGRPRIDRTVIREVQYQFEVNRCRNKEFQGSSAFRRTDGRTAEITTISPPFFQKAWG
ncbi:hypothetical protein DPMN_001278 [Dreissena polymorpha]|uniref:Uncharacterized protein n=1 Tax=Dreissena polymorpha TaxID=45954 RepID=A0A9D4RSX6_DREPO|nr:hypothetical protein DPMN_001278 [Dreissena polymorpha]